MSRFCRHCGAPLDPGEKFCGSCGAQIQEIRQPDTAGRADAVHRKDNTAGPLRYLKESVRAGTDSVRQLFKNPRRLIPFIALGALWLVLALLPALGINPWPVKLLSFLTFAQGGMYGGVWGIIGGILGKAVFAYFVSALVLPLFRGKNPFKGAGNGEKGFFSGLAVHSANAAAPLVIGLGLALVAYNFLTGNASLVNSMAGVGGADPGRPVDFAKGRLVWGLMLSIVHKSPAAGCPRS
jgi:hypothetical protein